MKKKLLYFSFFHSNPVMQNLKFKYRLYPSPEQVAILRQTAGNCRYVWNYFLAREMDTYEKTKKFNFYNKNSADLTLLKQEKTTKWLTEAPSVAMQQSLRMLDQALKASFKKKGGTSSGARKGFPKFKSRKNHEASFTLTMVSASNIQYKDRPLTLAELSGGIRDGAGCSSRTTFYIPKVGNIPFVFSRGLPSNFASCQIKQEAGRWFLVLTVKKPRTRQHPLNPHQPKKEVGIDLNSKEYVFSDGTVIPMPKFFCESQAKIKRLQQSLSRKEKGSANRSKAQLKLARTYAHVQSQRLDFAHKLTTSLIQTYDTIYLEDLNVLGIQRFNGKITHDNILGMFRAQLEYKAELYDRRVVCIDRFFPSSKKCSSCGTVKAELPLSQRTYHCNSCGLTLDRDRNAALNILAAGQAVSV